MKTLEDFIKGYPNVEVILVADFRDGNDKYYLVKQPNHNMFYFLKNREVLKRDWLPGDQFPSLSLQYINDKKNLNLPNEIKEQKSYKAFVKFIKENTGKDYSI